LSAVPGRLRAARSDREVARWVEQGWVELSGSRLRCTPEGWLRLDALVGGLTGSARTV
jgi:coproporphyrinogen III oxidase-like Fe-S oxidoreductase